MIYATKTAELAERLGPASHEPLLLMLARSLVNATREDLLPEFRDYSSGWGWGQGSDGTPLEPAALRRRGPKSAIAVVAGWGRRHAPETIFPVLVEAAAWTLLHVDAGALTRTDAELADNVGWLDFTHALTFADATRIAVSLRPELWPAVLLQMACFIGRNAAYVDPTLDEERFARGDTRQFLAQETDALFDHGRDRFIISVHLLKTLLAAGRLISVLPAQASMIASAVNRFLHAPMKGRTRCARHDRCGNWCGRSRLGTKVLTSPSSSSAKAEHPRLRRATERKRGWSAFADHDGGDEPPR